MKVASFEFEYDTPGEFELVEITDKVEEAVAKAGVTNGMACISSEHTTAGILINEHEEGFFSDLKEALRRLAPKDMHYKHNDLRHRKAQPGEPRNGHSHILSSLISASQTLPIIEGKLKLGAWQSIFLIELDSARFRRITVTVIGE